MKIYEIGTGYTPIPAQMGAATEIVVAELTTAFLKKGIDVEIVDICSPHRAPTDLPIAEVNVPTVFTKKDVSLGIMHKMKRVVYSIRLAQKLKSILKAADEPVVLHFHNQYNLYFFLKLVSPQLRKKATIAYTVHSYIWGTAWEEIEETVKKRYFQEIACVQNADVVFVLNDITIDHFVTKLGVLRERIHKVINGVNTETYARLADEQIEMSKQQYDLSGKKILFQVGSVCERKNQRGSVEMLAEYLMTHRDVVYMYAGGVIDEEYQQGILQFAQEKGIASQVRYLGELAPGERLNALYNMADVSVFTSTLESFGLVIIEAISAGTPVILGSEPLFDLQSGYYVYCDNAEFVQIVDRLLNQPKGGSDFQDVLDAYSWDTVAQVHLSILENIKTEKG